MDSMEKILSTYLPDRFPSGRQDQIFTPPHIAKEMVDALPDEIWNSKTTFLDPACKSGIFLHEIYKKLMASESVIKDFPDKKERREHILNNQLFGIALDDNCWMLSTRTTYGYLNPDSHIVTIENYIAMIKNPDQRFLYEALKKEFGTMKFDVVIGNPPYQDTSGKSSIYNKFVELSLIISDLVCMITRDNWMNGKAFKGMRDKLVANGSITSIVHYPKNGEIFKNVSVTVAYFVWERHKQAITKYVRIKDGNVILKQDLDITNGIIYKSEISKSILNKVGAFKEWPEKYNTRSYPFMDQRKRYSMDSKSVADGEHTVAVMINRESPVYVSIDNFSNVREVYSYKVMCGVIVNEASVENPGNVLTNIKSLGKNTVASETWSLIGTFDTEEETINCSKYIHTRFVRFIANQSVNGRSNVTDNTFECIPLQDFTNQSDIDWSQSIADIDKQLYAKYNLTEEEIEYIEKTIKAM